MSLSCFGYLVSSFYWRSMLINSRNFFVISLIFFLSFLFFLNFPSWVSIYFLFLCLFSSLKTIIWRSLLYSLFYSIQFSFQGYNITFYFFNFLYIYSAPALSLLSIAFFFPFILFSLICVCSIYQWFYNIWLSFTSKCELLKSWWVLLVGGPHLGAELTFSIKGPTNFVCNTDSLFDFCRWEFFIVPLEVICVVNEMM